MLGLLVAGLSCGPVVGAVLITVAALIKVPAAAGLVVLPLLSDRRWRAAGVVAVTSVVTAVVCSVGLGWGWVSTLDAGSARRSMLSVSTGAGAAVGAVGVANVAGLVTAAVVAGGI